MHFGPTIVYSLSSFSLALHVFSVSIKLNFYRNTSSRPFQNGLQGHLQAILWCRQKCSHNLGPDHVGISLPTKLPTVTQCNTSSRLWFQNGLQTNFQAILWCIQKFFQNLDPDYVGISLWTVLCKIPMFLLRFRGESF